MALALTTGKRKIKDGSRFNRFFPPESSAYGSNTVLQNNATVEETVKHIADVIKRDRADTAGIAKMLKGKTRKETLANIHNFMTQYLQYDTEAGEKLRSPRRTWWVGQKQKDNETGDTGVDCDDLTIFAGSILKSLNIPFYIRIVKIDKDDFQHVYLVVPVDGDELSGTYFTLDGVLSDFNYEYPFKTDKTFDMNGIKIEYLGKISSETGSKVLNMLKEFRYEIGAGQLSPTKINKSDLLNMLDYAIENWDKNRKEAFKNLADAERKHYPGQTFFSKLYGYEKFSSGKSLSGDWMPSDWTAEDQALLDNNNPKIKDDKPKSGSSVWDAVSSVFNAAANFDWGLIGGHKRNGSQNNVNYSIPQQNYSSPKSQVAGMSLASLGGIVLVGGLVYLAYQNYQKVKTQPKPAAVRRKKTLK